MEKQRRCQSTLVSGDEEQHLRVLRVQRTVVVRHARITDHLPLFERYPASMYACLPCEIIRIGMAAAVYARVGWWWSKSGERTLPSCGGVQCEEPRGQRER